MYVYGVFLDCVSAVCVYLCNFLLDVCACESFGLFLPKLS